MTGCWAVRCLCHRYQLKVSSCKNLTSTRLYSLLSNYQDLHVKYVQQFYVPQWIWDLHSPSSRTQLWPRTGSMRTVVTLLSEERNNILLIY
ncbi:hypothetical protein AcW2_000867 [Taiwanofungus camphoratus]|nr:hypothetical protein AcW2_000867 [Antrodia cinnamomea]